MKDDYYWIYMFSSGDYMRGRELLAEGKVQDFSVTLDEENFSLKCRVLDRRPADVTIEGRGTDDISMNGRSCTCSMFRAARNCKHVAAALLAYANFMERPEKYPDFKLTRVPRTSASARSLLRAMRGGDEETAQPEASAHLAPVLRMPSYAGGFALSLKVGIDRLYVVKDIDEFLGRVDRRVTHEYGKRLTLNHDPANFDEPSRKVIDFVKKLSFMYSLGKGSFYKSYTVNGFASIDLPPRLFEMYYDTLMDLPLVDDSGKAITLFKGDPEVRAVFTRRDGMVYLNVKPEGGWRFLKEGSRLCVAERAVLLVSEAFAKNVGPLLAGEKSEFRFTFQDMPSFCSLVLPRIRGGVELVDDDGVLTEYMPEECVPRFYFDLEDHQLKCRLMFHYDSGDIRYGQRMAAGRRDLRVEDAMVQALERDFPYQDEAHNFVEPDEAKYTAFLCGPIDAYRERGEVFISERLNSIELKPPKATVGVSVSDGMLTLSLDTGGFPPEELEALYQSLLARRRYYRLKDGRFMRLKGDGSGIEALAETTHMTQLSAADVKGGEVSLPTYRALYLDNALEGREGLRVKRNERFRELVRRFKAVEDSDYQLPEGVSGELRPYQETGYRWLRTLESCGFGGILADEMGLGKTLQTIVFFASRPRSETGLPHLVACPASLVLNWQDEISRFAPAMKVKLIEGTLRERRRLLAEADDADVWVTSYDMLKRDIDLYAGRPFYGFVLDEGQFVKNQSTKASKAVKQINCRQRFVLTGTPVENRLSELWNLFDFLMPGYLFAHQRFVEKLEKPIVQKGDAEARQQLNRLVRPFILRRLKKDVLKELPEKIEHVRRIQLTEEERKVYHAQSLATIKQIAGSEKKFDVLAALMRLRQICCDPALCFENYEGESSKLEACLELIRSTTENGHQVLVFSQFTSMLARIRERLDGEGIDSYTLQGSTPKAERARLVKAFNSGGARVFLISLKAGGTGLNLTAADVVIHFDPWWNMAAQTQATDRAHRIGQQNCVQVYKLIASDTVEERILDLQNKKAELLDAVTEDNGESIMNMSQEDLMALIRDD